ncbi:MAG: FtsQ-type POTRA domain-containing protein, partial [Armatimonadota bacterium]
MAATVGCAYGVASSPWLRIERVTIRCPDPDVAQEAAAAARIAPDATLVTVPAWRLRRDIGSCPRVKRATVQRRWQHALDIIVVPRQPAVALVAQSDCVLADEDGVCIRRVPERPAHLPVVRGPVVADIAPGDIVSRARMATAWECLQWTERLPVLGTVSVDISVPQRICVYADDGTKGIIGRPTDLGRKLACFAAALQHLRVRGLRARYVDV